VALRLTRHEPNAKRSHRVRLLWQRPDHIQRFLTHPLPTVIQVSRKVVHILFRWLLASQQQVQNTFRQRLVILLWERKLNILNGKSAERDPFMWVKRTGLCKHALNPTHAT
jgi:hypothetical protein